MVIQLGGDWKVSRYGWLPKASLWLICYSFPHACPIFYILSYEVTVHFIYLFYFLLSSPLAGDQQQSMDAAVLHLLPLDCQLLRPQHVCGRGGGEFPQMPTAPGGGGGPATGGETTASHGEEEKK